MPMARIRTLNKRRRRREARDREFERNLPALMRTLQSDVIQQVFEKALAEAWGLLDPKYRNLKSQQWPDMVYEDVLDAEFIG